MDWSGGGPIRSLRKLGKLIGYFEKSPGPSQAHDNIIPGNKASLSAVLALFVCMFSFHSDHVTLAVMLRGDAWTPNAGPRRELGYSSTAMDHSQEQC